VWTVLHFETKVDSKRIPVAIQCIELVKPALRERQDLPARARAAARTDAKWSNRLAWPTSKVALAPRASWPPEHSLKLVNQREPPASRAATGAQCTRGTAVERGHRIARAGRVVVRMAVLAVAILVGCAAEPAIDSCEQASAALAACTGEVPEGFREACLADPDRIASEILGSVEPDSCQTVDDGKADSIGERAFVAACVPAINAAYLTTWARSPWAKPLPRELRDRLRPFHGDLVDRVKVSFGATMLNRWKLFGREFVFGLRFSAQTYGNEIFFRHAYKPGDAYQIETIGHELAHAQQAERLGGFPAFAAEYCAAYYRARYSYDDNALEVEAYATEDSIRACIRERACP
jgi:hypothetical protein